MSELESDFEEKEYTIYLDFETYIAPEDLEGSSQDFKIIGIDAEHPIVQLNGKIFKGTYDYAIGTSVFFEENPNPPVADPLFDTTAKQFYRICTKTQKQLKMERIYIEKIVPTDEPSECEKLHELKIRRIPNMTYTDALNLVLPMGCAPPRIVLDDFLPPIVSTVGNEMMEVDAQHLNPQPSSSRIVEEIVSNNAGNTNMAPVASTSSYRPIKEEKIGRQIKSEKTMRQQMDSSTVSQQPDFHESSLKSVKQEK